MLGSPSAQILRALGSAQVTTGYFGDLAATGEIRLTVVRRCRVKQRRYLIVAAGGFVRIGMPSAGGLVRIGIPSGAGTCGTAADAYTPTSPNIRMDILITCFMGCSPPATRIRRIGSSGA